MNAPNNPDTGTQLVLLKVPEDIAQIATETGITEAGAASLWQGFAPHFQELTELTELAEVINDDEPHAARTMRLKTKACRVVAEKKRKELKADSLRRGKAIDGFSRIFVYQAKAIEDKMEAIEKAEELREAARKQALLDVRLVELSPYVEDASVYNLGDMTDLAWTQCLVGAVAAHEAIIEAERKAEEQRKADELARIKREKEEAKERERIRKENERLAKELEKERKERAAAEAKVAAEREEAERKVAAEVKAREEAEQKAQAERDRLAAIERAKQVEIVEKAAADQAKLQRQIDANREVRLKEEAANANRLKDERAATEKEAAAPDREKLVALAEAVRSLPMPSLKTSDGAELVLRITDQAEKFAAWIEGEAGNLGGTS